MSLFDRRNPSPENEPTQPFKPQRYNAPRPLTASAARIDMTDKKQVDAINKRRATDKWQDEAWEYYDLIGEIKFSAGIVANVTSRINLYAGYVDDSSTIPSNIKAVDGLDEAFVKAAQDTLYWLESGNGGTSGLLRSAALNLFVVGECYLVREPARFSTGEPQRFQIRSTNEIISTQGRNSQVVIKPRRDSKPTEYIPLPSDGYITRIWRNHPRYLDEADSSMKGVLDFCDELLLVSRTAAATAKSRLNGGLLFVPDGLSNITQNDGEVDGEQGAFSADESDNFEEELIDAMTNPIADVSSSSAVVPLIVRGPAEMGNAIKLIKFERSFDPALAARSEKLIERILASIDIPKDIAAGMSNVKYANAIVIEEQLYKAHIEPLILLICDMLTIGFLRPALRAQGFPEEVISRAVVWYDPTTITAKPSKAEAAVTLYNLKAISLAALRRANGFSEGDAPSQLETAQRLAEERGTLSDQMSQTIFDSMLPEEMKQAAQQQALAQSDPASANALQQALGQGGAPETAPPTDPSAAGPDQAPDSATIEQTSTDAPPTLMEP